MAYGSKSKYMRRYARKSRGKVAKMAKGRSSQIQVLAKSVRSIQRKINKQHQLLNYVQSDSAVNQNGDYTYYNLCNYSSLTPVFGTDADDDNNYKIVHQSVGLDMYLTLENTINNEENTITFTMFLVSLKDDIGGAFNPSNGALSLNVNQHYVIRNGLTLLNKKCFNIHKIKRRVLTNHGTALTSPSAQSQGGSDCRWYWKISMNKVVQNPTGDWKNLQSALDPSKQYYVLIFNDNTTLDGESPALTYNFVHTMKTIV